MICALIRLVQACDPISTIVLGPLILGFPFAVFIVVLTLLAQCS